MAQDPAQPSRYVITARAQRGVVQQTRRMAASAVVLARSWQDAGYTDIQVLDPQGQPLTPESYAIQIMNGRRRFR